MELSDLAKEYQEEIDLRKRNISTIVKDFDAEMTGIVMKSSEICGKVTEIGLGVRALDRLEEVTGELSEVNKLARFLHSGYVEICRVNKENLDDFVDGYVRSRNFIEKLPAIQSKLLDQLRNIVKEQKNELVQGVYSQWQTEFIINNSKILIGKNIEKAKKHLQSIHLWENMKTEAERKIVEFFINFFNRKTKVSVKVSGAKLSISEESLCNIAETFENIERVMGFCQKLLWGGCLMEKMFEKVKTIIEMQAAECANCGIIKNTTLFQVKLLEKALERMGIGRIGELARIIENCEEICVAANKNQLMSNLKTLILNVNCLETVKIHEITVTKAVERYVNALKSAINTEFTLEMQKVTVLNSIREAAVLYQALRNVKTTENTSDLLLFCSDSEYFIEEIKKFSSLKDKFPDYLHFLLDYSDIIPLFSSNLTLYYEKIYTNYKNSLQEKAEKFDFTEFEKEISYQEAVLLSILKDIRKNEVRGVLPRQKACIILGKLINDLISETISKVLSIKDICIDETHLLKHFFEKLFDVKDVFAGESPIDYCEDWERLEALLEIIEGRLIDIITSYERKRFEDLFTARQLRKLIKALFQDTDKRKFALKTII